MESLIDKWNRIYSQAKPEPLAATDVLAENAYLLPDAGSALDLACGLGGNAIFLAQRGLAVTAWDISSVAIAKLAATAQRESLNINACQQNITRQLITESHFDVITVSRFLDRSLMGAIIASLKPGGLIFYQTFAKEKTTGLAPHSEDFLLGRNELLNLFSPLTVVFYRENSLCGNPQKGLRGESQFIGQNTHGLMR